MRKNNIFVLLIVFIITIVFLCSCSNEQTSTKWKKDTSFDISVPVVGEEGWYLVFEDDFEGNCLNQNIVFGDNYQGETEIWTCSPHAIRWNSDDSKKPGNACYWCDQMVEVKDSNVIIHSYYDDSHECDICPSEGRFTSGIETRIIDGDNSVNKGTEDRLLFSQAFGYFEVRAKLPKSKGLWSAFWLQSSNMRKVGNDGQDGTEIDVFESAFINNIRSRMGHALLWDGYSSDGKCSAYITTLKQDLYDGYHTYALKWTPDYYVFYIDGVATWATRDGGVSKVQEFLRLTVEIDAGDGWGPHGQRIGKFDNSKVADDFMVDYVKVYQNSSYLQYIIDDSDFEGNLDLS